MANLRRSAEVAARRVLTVLQRERLLQISLRVELLVDVFDDEGHKDIEGRSAELAVALGIAAELREHSRLDAEGRPLTIEAVTATGVLDDEGWVRPVDKVPEKLESALSTLPAGALVFYPADNRDDVTSDIAAHATTRGISLIPVERLEEALCALGIDIHYFKTPYLGLSSFGYEDAGIFFGRDRASAALQARLHACRQACTPSLLVVGASGSGKSSIVQAGLLPLLLREPEARWCITSIKPSEIDPAQLHRALWDAWRSDRLVGERLPLPNDAPPAQALALWLEERHPDIHWLLVIDQLEEVFHSRDWSADSRRIALSQALHALLDHGITVVGTLRSDFMSAYIGSPLKTCFEDRFFTLAAPEPPELRQIIEQPAQQAGFRFEERDHKSLATQIEEDTAGQGDVLPLLEFALTHLHQRRDSQQHQFLWRVYEETGGLPGSIGSEAEAKFESLSQQARAALPQLLWNLSAMREDRPGQDDRIVSRPAPAADPEEDPSLFELEEQFVKARLLVRESDGDSGKQRARLRVAHEALLTHWQRAEQIIETNRQDLKLRAVLEQEAGRWKTRLEDVGYLRQGGKPLAEAHDILERREADLDPSVRQYVRASIRESERKARRRTRILTTVTAAMALLALVAGFAAWIAVEGKREAEAQRQEAEDQRKVAEHNLGLSLVEMADTFAGVGRGFLAYEYALEGLKRLAPDRDASAAARARTRIAAGTRYRTAYVSTRASGFEAQVTSVALSPDGRILASGSGEPFVHLWDVASGQMLAKLEGHGTVFSVAFSPDGRTLAAGGTDKSIHLWDVASRRERAKLEGHMDIVTSVAFSPDGRTLASGSCDRTIRLWSAERGGEISMLDGPKSCISNVLFSPDGRTLASGGNDNEIRLWDWASGRVLTQLKGHGSYTTALAFSPNGETLAFESNDRDIALWDVARGEYQALLRGHQEGILSVAFSPDGRILASGSRDTTIRLWDVASSEPLAVLDGHGKAVTSIAFSSDGLTLASGSQDDTIRLWDLTRKQPRTLIKGHDAWARDIAFSPDGLTLASVGADNWIHLWDLASGQIRAVLKGHEKQVLTVAFSPDGRTLGSGSADKTVRLWDAASGRLRTVLRGHRGDVLSVAFSPDGRTLASASDDKTVRLWNPARGDAQVLQGHGDSVLSVAFSPDGQTLASGSFDHAVFLWSVESATVRARLPEPATKNELDRLPDWVVRAIPSNPGAAVYSVAFSPDGKILASTDDDGIIRLWDLASGRATAAFSTHSSRSMYAVFSPDGQTLASGDQDGAISLWNVKSRQLWAKLSGSAEEVSAVAFSLDGRTLASSGADETIRIWDLSFLDVVQHPEKSILRFESQNRLRLEGLEVKSVPIRPKLNVYDITAHLEPYDSPDNILSWIEPHLYGNGVPTQAVWSPNHPFHWLPSAERGDGEAMIQLGNLYLRNDDLVEARRWFEQAVQVPETRMEAQKRLELFLQVERLEGNR